jgi:parallel beta-helix repeat protein
MITHLATGIALLLLVSTAPPANAHTGAAGGPVGSDTVHVAEPTGEREADRASILAALERVRPGGTIQFTAGVYRIGGFNLDVAVPGITLLGHPDGTTLRGCDPEVFADYEVARFACNALGLSGEAQTVRGLTFEYAWQGVTIGCCLPGTMEEFAAWAGPDPVQAGGHLVEGNTFRFTPNGMRVLGRSAEPRVVRSNRFVDVYHAIGINGGGVHFIDNDVSVHEPHLVPTSTHPGDPVNISPVGRAGDHTSCSDNLVARNRIEGYPHGIGIAVFAPNTSCRRNEIRDNTIIVRRVRFASAWVGIRIAEAGDSTVVGVPLHLVNFPTVEPETYGDPEEAGPAVIEDNLIEGNRVLGAEGIGIELVHASRNRIVGNTITRIEARAQFPGTTLLYPVLWRDANGAGIWVSPGSEENEIAGNIFEHIANTAVVIEGDRNRVETRNSGDEVRDLGTGNRVSARDAGGNQR